MKKTKKGFTLVELLVVIAIIAIIAAVAVPVTIGQIEKSKIKTAKSEMQNIVSAINTAYGDMSTGDTSTQAALADLIVLSKVEYVESFTIADGQTVVFKLKDSAFQTKVVTGDEPANASITYKLDVKSDNIKTSGSGKYNVAANGKVTYAPGV